MEHVSPDESSPDLFTLIIYLGLGSLSLMDSTGKERQAPAKEIVGRRGISGDFGGKTKQEACRPDSSAT